MDAQLIYFIALKAIGAAFFVLLALRLVTGFRARHCNPALDLLGRRFAEGQIGVEEYRAKKAELEDL
jgi:uncharacterized membrane protein